jgi:hypothetical protein
MAAYTADDLRSVLSTLGLPQEGSLSELEVRVQGQLDGSPYDSFYANAALADLLHQCLARGKKVIQPDRWRQWHRSFCALVTAADPCHEANRLALPPTHCEGGSAFLTFTLSAQDRAALLSGTAVLQVMCTLQGDKVQNRFFWPDSTSLCVNGVPVCVSTHAPVTLAANTRALDAVLRQPTTRLLLHWLHGGAFKVAARVARPVAASELVNKLPLQLSLSDSVGRLLGWGDPEEVQQLLSLVCPVSGQRVKTPTRCAACTTGAVFDLHAYVARGVWVCPLCNAAAPPTALVVDRFVTVLLKRCDADAVLVDGWGFTTPACEQ